MVSGQPDGRETPISKFVDDMVAFIGEFIAQLDRMIAPRTICLEILNIILPAVY